MTTTRVLKLAGIGVDKMGAIADRLQNERLLRLENPDTDLAPAAGVVASKREVEIALRKLLRRVSSEIRQNLTR